VTKRSRKKSEKMSEEVGKKSEAAAACTHALLLSDETKLKGYFKLQLLIKNKNNLNTTRCSGCCKYFHPSDRDNQ
jgi:hypothetical protein